VNSKSWKNIAFAIVLCGLGSVGGVAQTFDSSATGTVKGAYFVRHIFAGNVDQITSAIGRAVSLTGAMTFDGAGNYSFTGQMSDSMAGSSGVSYSVSGMYAVSASGLIQLTNPIDTTTLVFGGVGALGPSAIVGSSTETTNAEDDVFIAIPAGSGASNSTVAGAFNGGFIDFLQGNASQVRDGYFTITSNGSGSFGTVTVNGAMANQSSTATTQNYSGVSYSVANGNGSGTLTFPTASTPLSTLVSGQKTLYVSADGNILIGGSPTGYDLLVAIKASTASVSDSTFQGTYFSAGLENDASDVSAGNNNIDSFYGSALGLGQGDGILHQRLVFFNNSAYDFTGYAPEKFSNGAIYNDGFYQNLLAANGQANLQVGTASFYSLIVNLQAKSTPATGVFINPLGILNAASYAPITNSVAPGEFVSIFGSNLASGVFMPSSLPLPMNLGNVSVTVNSRPAPLSYVGPGQINILVPYGTSEKFATFQVSNNGTLSNKVTVYTNLSAPGIFTGSPSGIGEAAVLHANYSPVSQSSPAQVGETVLLYLTGLGSVTPAVGDGAAAPSSPLSMVDENLGLDIADQSGNDANVTSIPFAGLAPGFAGLYQINFQIPSGLVSGAASLNIGTQDAYSSEAVIYVQSGLSASARPGAEPRARSARPARKSGSRSRNATHRGLGELAK